MGMVRKPNLVRVVTKMQEPDWRCPHDFRDMEWVDAPGGDGMIHRCKKCGYAYLEIWMSPREAAKLEAKEASP